MSQSPKRRKLSSGEYEISPAKVTEVETDPAPEVSTKPDQRRSLFVRSLPASVTTQRLTELFSQSFPLKHATVVLDPATKISRGFGFVTFTDAEDAQAAVAKFNNTAVDGRRIKVEIAESRNREIEEDITGARKETKNVKAEALRAQRQQNILDNRPPKLIVRNLPWSIKTEEDLSKLFRSYGKVKHVTVPKGKGGQQAGFGFVVLRGKKNAENALNGVNGKEVDGRTLAVDWAVDKEDWEKAQNEDAINGVDATTTAEETVNGERKQDAADDDISSDGENEGGALADEDVEEEEDDESDAEEAIMNGDDEDLDSEISETSTTATKKGQNNTTVFVRNLPFTTDDEILKDHFHSTFGPVRYARVVYDQETERSRGTGFVCFFNESDAKECVKNAPKHVAPPPSFDRYSEHKSRKNISSTHHSILQNENLDPSGRYTLDGRILQVTRALAKEDADRRMKESSDKRDTDKRRLYLLSEGTIPKGSKLYDLLGKSEIDIRESSARQRQQLVKKNANLGLSLTRLSIRNIPRWVTSKDLKALAREAVVGFARDVKEGKRQPLGKDEMARGGEADRIAEKQRKEKGKGIVKQVKIVFESEQSGSKVGEGKGGRSRGYGFIEYYGHRNALAGLRWLNGHLVKPSKSETKDGEGGGGSGGAGKRLIVEFAIENAQVVQRRAEREKKFERRSQSGSGVSGLTRQEKSERKKEDEKSGDNNRKRKRDGNSDWNKSTKKLKGGDDGKAGAKTNGNNAKKGGRGDGVTDEEKNKIAMRNRVIAQKRMKRKNRKG